MRYMLISKTSGPAEGQDERLYQEMGAFIAELTQQGVLVATGAWEPGGVHIRSTAGQITDEPVASDGPPVGFALVDVATLDEVVALSKRFWSIVGDGEGDIHQVYGPE